MPLWEPSAPPATALRRSWMPRTPLFQIPPPSHLPPVSTPHQAGLRYPSPSSSCQPLQKGCCAKTCVNQNSSLNAVRGSKAVSDLPFIQTCLGTTKILFVVLFCLFDTDKYNCAKTTQQEFWHLVRLPDSGAALSGFTSVSAETNSNKQNAALCAAEKL